MADEDDVDVLGEFDLENLFTKDEGRLTCYDGMDVPSHWLLDTSAQPCWYTENKTLSPEDLVPMASSWEDSDVWTQRERELLEKGLGLFGRSWPRLAQYVGTKTAQQVKAYTTSLSSNEGPDISALGFTEIIDDIQIPASIEEVIAVVSTAQPTVPTPTSSTSTKFRTGGKRGRPPKNRADSDVARPKGKRGPKPRPNTTIVHRMPKLKKSMKRVMVLEPKDNKVCTIGDEEVIRIQKHSEGDDEDEDVVVDVEDDSEPPPKLSGQGSARRCSNSPSDTRANGDASGDLLSSDDNAMRTDSDSDGRKAGSRPQTSEEREAARKLSEQLRLKSHQDILEKIYNIPPPETEVLLDPFSVSDQEMEIHAEFFEGKSVKTPSRYLKIRNHIIECWRSSRPLYISKTSVRSGLKNCGDVNCVGRIHAFLEQIGAINFGCEQARYYRPVFTPSSLEPLPAPNAAKQRGVRVVQPAIHTQLPTTHNGGYTITHREDGTTQMQVPAPAPSRPKNQGHTSQQQIQLITCSKFDQEKPAPYSVVLCVSALAVMDVHAHATYCEVIGLLGGDYDPDGRVVSITRTQPCRAASSGVHCDMCPVSQMEASERLLDEGFSVVGWYHSHPAFSPNPSLQDIITQSSVQNYSKDRPFVGFILSPHSVASTYRCVVVMSGSQEAATPYRLPVRLATHSLDVASLERHLTAVFDNLRDQGTKLRLSDTVNQHTIPISYLQKCIESVRYHLDQSADQLEASEKMEILQAILDCIKNNT